MVYSFQVITSLFNVVQIILNKPYITEFIALANDFIPAADKRQLFLVFQGSGNAVDVTLVLYVLDGLRYLLTEAQNLLLKLDQSTRRQLI